MGHLINPISFRLYYVRYWNNVWSLNLFNYNYSYLNILDYNINLIISKYFSLYLKSIKGGIFFLNVKIIRLYNKIIYNIYLHDSFYDMNMFQLFRKVKRFFFSENKKTVIQTKFLYKVKFRMYSFKIRINYQKVKLKIFLREIFKYLRKKKFFYKKNFFFLIKKSIFKYFLFKSLRRKKRRFFKHYKIFLKLFLYFFFKKLNHKFWIYIKLVLHKYLGYLYNYSYFYNNNFFVYNILSVSKYFILAKVLSNYIRIRLTQKYLLSDVLRSIHGFFYSLYKKYNLIKGYKIQCAGRFTRKQRALWKWKLFRSIKPSTLKSQLDYSISEVALRYGKCAIKVWIRKTRRAKQHYFYIF